MEYQIILVVIATVIGISSYIPYIKDIFTNKTKPHAFSWFIWGLLTAIAFAAQVKEGAGVGAWVAGFSAAMCLGISGIAFVRGNKHICRMDWFCLGAALLGIILWKITSNPLTAVVIVTLVDMIGFVPTFRKAYHHPHEETALSFALSGIKWVFGLMALEVFNTTTTLYPASLVLTNMVFVIMVLIRRRQ